MRIMIDTNVILDCLLDRQPFADDAQEILELCARGKHEGCILASTVTDIFYIAEKYMDDMHELYLLMDDLLEELLLIALSRRDLMIAVDRRELDFEDCVLSVCAESAGCDVIVTRNLKDFKNSNVMAVLPKTFIRKYN